MRLLTEIRSIVSKFLVCFNRSVEYRRVRVSGFGVGMESRGCLKVIVNAAACVMEGRRK